jgi:hypothetical protein
MQALEQRSERGWPGEANTKRRLQVVDRGDA